MEMRLPRKEKAGLSLASRPPPPESEARKREERMEMARRCLKEAKERFGPARRSRTSRDDVEESMVVAGVGRAGRQAGTR